MNGVSIQLFFDLFDCDDKMFLVLVSYSKSNDHEQIVVCFYSEFLVNYNDLWV